MNSDSVVVRNKAGRKALPIGLKAVTTSLRLRPDRLALYKKLGGVKWLNAMLDILDGRGNQVG
jgi:hypothetical protein